MDRKKSVTILLPTLNEEETIKQVINEIPIKRLKNRGYEVNILVVDGHSVDKTRELAEQEGAHVIIQEDRGKGKGVRKAFSIIDTDYLFMLDADGTYPPWYILAMLEQLESGYDVVLGSRLSGWIQPGAMSTLNFFGNKMLTLMANTLYGTQISDLCTGLWGLNRKVLNDLHLNSDHFELEAELFAAAVKRNYRVIEVPITYKRRGGRAKLSPINALSIARKLITRRFVTLR